jgi:uncharacterized protein
MPDAGRNDPCPCKSGKKYKRCCGARAIAVPDQTDRLRNAAFALEERIMRAMDRFAAHRFGRKWYENIAEFLGLAEEPTEHEVGTLLVPWSYYLLPLDGVRLVEWFLVELDSDLRDDERRFLLAQIDSWPSLWEAREAHELLETGSVFGKIVLEVP